MTKNNNIVKKILSLALVFLLFAAPIYTLYSAADPDSRDRQINQRLVFKSEKKLNEFVRVYNDRARDSGEDSVVTDKNIFFKEDFLKVMCFLRFESLAPESIYTPDENDYLVELFWQIAADNDIE